MAIKSIIGATCTCLAVVSFNAEAALVSRLGGLAYYDDVANLTWLADANYAKTSGYDADGLMNWWDANNWAGGLSVDGVGGWRLPKTPQFDASCDTQGSEGSFYFNCTGSEMGHLFYNVLGGIAGSSLTTTHNANYDLFSNVQSNRYWSATEFVPTTNIAWLFYMGNARSPGGWQTANFKEYGLYAWAVHSGDVVPVPAAVWLFGSGLIGLIGVARRKT